MNPDEQMFINNIRGKIIRGVDIRHPGFFSHGYLKLIVEDPEDGAQYRAQINLG